MLPFDEIDPLTAPAQQKAFEAQNSITSKITELIALYAFMANTGDFVSAFVVERDFARYYHRQMRDFVNSAPNVAADTVTDYSRQWYEDKSEDIDIPFEQNTPIHTIATQNAEQTRGIIETITPGNTGFTERTSTGTKFTNTTDFFRRELQDGITQVVAGNKTYTQVIREAVKKMSNSGVRTMTTKPTEHLPNGRTERIDVIVRRAIMTGIKDTITDGAYELARQRSITIAQISLHEGARETHWWGGFAFSIYPTREINPQTNEPYLTDEQLRERSGGWITDWNCRHFITFLDRGEKPLYTIREIKAHQKKEKQTTPYKGKDFTPYTATKRMRDLEREMRALRLEGMMYKMKYDALRKAGMKASEIEALEHPYTETRLRYRALRAEYSEFAEKMGLKTQFERVSYDMLGRVF